MRSIALLVRRCETLSRTPAQATLKRKSPSASGCSVCGFEMTARESLRKCWTEGAPDTSAWRGWVGGGSKMGRNWPSRGGREPGRESRFAAKGRMRTIKKPARPGGGYFGGKQRG